MRKRFLMVILLALSIGFISVNAKASMTIATFADPSRSSGKPLFKVDFTLMQITGEWGDSRTGLTLRIPCNSGHTFTDAWFEMDAVPITSASGMSGQIGSGVINFYANGSATDPLLIVSFKSGTVSRYGSGADERLTTNNVTITGSEIAGTLSQEQFSFSFANLAKLQGSTNWAEGFTATAAFASSAIEIVEPATICILGLGVLGLVRRKKRA
jgi:hypothetical protein